MGVRQANFSLVNLKGRGTAYMVNVVISPKQAQEFAQTVYADIGDYVKSHQREFEEFLAEQRKEVVTLCPDKERSERNPI